MSPHTLRTSFKVFLEAKGVRIMQYQFWQYAFFHPDLDGKMLYYPRKGSLIHETEFGFSKVGEFHEVEELWPRMRACFVVQKKAIETREIECTGCHDMVEARLTNGKEMYPASPELADVPFWVCDTCGAFVGTHHKTKDRLKPLGSLATKEVKRWRMLIHQVLDPLWKDGKIERGHAYARISSALGHTYHTGEIYDEEEGEFVYGIVKAMRDELAPPTGPWNR